MEAQGIQGINDADGVDVNAAKFAGFWIRVVAMIIDCLVLIIPASVLAFALRGLAALDGGESLTSILLETVVLTLGWWLYFSLCHSSAWQATVGKKALGLMVVSDEGKRLSFGHATGRYFASIISSLTLMIGYMMAGWTKRKRSLHDIIASTYVVKR